MAEQRGKIFDEDVADKLRREQYRAALEAYEKRMSDRNDRHDKH